jgi:hypothetical protein
MARIIRLHGSPHDDAQRLLPWYVTGELDAEDLALVDGHLPDCAECRADLELERRLMSELAALPLPEHEEAVMPAASLLPRRRPIRTALNELWQNLTRPVAVGWALAAQAVLVVGAFSVVPFLARPVTYQALSAPQPVAATMTGNIIVTFRPDLREQDLRRILNHMGARLVDGPTAADAYILRVSPEQRPAVLARLRAERQVVVAQPIDAPL